MSFALCLNSINHLLITYLFCWNHETMFITMQCINKNILTVLNQKRNINILCQVIHICGSILLPLINLLRKKQLGS